MSMSMHTAPALHIGKLRTRFVSGGELDEVQVRQWHEAFAEQDPADVVGRLVSDDAWLLIRHLPMHLRWRSGSAAPEVGRVWLQALQTAAQEAASASEPGNVLRYRTWRDGLADLLYRSALGETDRQWAWLRMGLIDRAGLAPAEALMQGAQTLLAQAEIIWPVLHHGLQAERDTGAFTAWARQLPVSMWMRCLQAAPQSHVWVQVWQAMSGASDAPLLAQAPDDASHINRHALKGPAQALLQWAARHPSLAWQIGDVLSVWLAALTAQAPHAIAASDTLTHAAAARHLRAARRCWQEVCQVGAGPMRQSSRPIPRPSHAPRPPPTSHTPGLPDRPSPLDAASTRTTPTQLAHAAHAAHHQAMDLPEAPAMPEPHHSVITAWAGALFFLRLLCQPGVMHNLHAQAGARHTELAEPTTAATTAALMQALAMALHVPFDDPVMRVMTMGQARQDISPRVQAAANRLVAQWAAWLNAQLPDAPTPCLPWVCQRPGRLQIEAGWIELHLDLDQIDTRLRRIGLDLDPGWVPFIGAVVRICYD